jgi:Glycosyl hydrolases family 2, sugar binding domain
MEAGMETDMPRIVSRHNDAGETGSHPDAMSRRAFLSRTAAAGAATLVSGHAVAQSRPEAPVPRGAPAPARAGLLYPQQNQVRNLLDVSGLWQFQLDPHEEGEAQGWFTALPAPRPIAVPCSWNDLFDDARDYLGLAWYWREVYVPSTWREQRVFLRIGSANYAAKVWGNGTVVAEHLGGHLPFVADVTHQLVWDRTNILAITVENKQLPERVPPGPGPAGGGVA